MFIFYKIYFIELNDFYLEMSKNKLFYNLLDFWRLGPLKSNSASNNSPGDKRTPPDHNFFKICVLYNDCLLIYLLIKIGSQIGAMSTILLIFATAIIGVYYAKYEGLNILKSGFAQLSKNETPAYEVISGAAIAFAALLLIIPGFATDVLGFLLIFPLTRKLFLGKFLKIFKKKTSVKKTYIDGEFEDIEDDKNRKI